MKIALIGYGKMGHEIEKAAIERGHSIALKITSSNKEEIKNIGNCDVAIEFTTPHSAVNNMYACLQSGVPVVTGTTGWQDRQQEVEQKCRELNGAMIHSSNFSIGVNLFFELNERLAGLMKNRDEYAVAIEEVHHVKKLDQPSGTAITLAQQIIKEHPHLRTWSLENQDGNNEILPISSKREGNVTGMHAIKYKSDVDSLTITHEAFSRKGFALGAVLAAEFIHIRKGIFTMKDVLNATV